MGITLPFTRTRKNGAAPPAGSGSDDDEGAGPREPAAFHVPGAARGAAQPGGAVRCLASQLPDGKGGFRR